MKIGIFGTGVVGSTIGSALTRAGHEVRMGSRTRGNDKAVAWVGAAGANASEGTFADAAAFGEIVFNCTRGDAALAVAAQAGAENLAGKVLVDVSNPLDFSKGFPPTLTVLNDDSLGEQLQRALPGTHVVKALNTLTAALMVEPSRLSGPHDLLICGNDAGAKATVTSLLRESFGWKIVRDLGDITNARGTEAWLLLWTRLYGHLGTPDFNLHLETSGGAA
ncbi:MAG: NAD(P)-binding domain-containing protein [Deltaproteobacteria bacterium]|nr:NAD(P)-binding domain-containing protein [Deltaproteobacteria bacterium]